jgi:hypothetical protein
MSPEQMAKLLHGREYRDETTPEYRGLARDNGLVIVYGASDDLVEFEGAIYEEFGTNGNDEVLFDQSGAIDNPCRSDDCPYYKRKLDAAPGRIKVRELYFGEAPRWSYETTIPHATFDIMEDGDVYCRGIVFRVSDIPQVTP